MADADAAETAVERGTRRLARCDQPAQRLSGVGGGRDQTLLGVAIAWVVEVLRASQAIGKVVVSEPAQVESGRGENLGGVVDPARGLDERNREDHVRRSVH